VANSTVAKASRCSFFKSGVSTDWPILECI
jgi:hypothetical protein